MEFVEPIRDRKKINDIKSICKATNEICFSLHWELILLYELVICWD